MRDEQPTVIATEETGRADWGGSTLPGAGHVGKQQLSRITAAPKSCFGLREPRDAFLGLGFSFIWKFCGPVPSSSQGDPREQLGNYGLKF